RGRDCPRRKSAARAHHVGVGIGRAQVYCDGQSDLPGGIEPSGAALIPPAIPPPPTHSRNYGKSRGLPRGMYASSKSLEFPHRLRTEGTKITASMMGMNNRALSTAASYGGRRAIRSPRPGV